MGRPKEFAERDAVEAAMELFWEYGYEGTSLDALEARTGLNRSSLYNTFGGKIELYCRALDAYAHGPSMGLERALREASGARALVGFLDGLGRFLRSRIGARGCLMVRTSVASPLGEEVASRVVAHFERLRSLFRARYAEGLARGEVNGALTADEAADALVTFVRGIQSAAAAGESRPRLLRALGATHKQLQI